MTTITKERFVAVLDAAGITAEQKKKLHAEFERLSPETHQDFLESIGIEAGEIRRIRQASAGNAAPLPRRRVRRTRG